MTTNKLNHQQQMAIAARLRELRLATDFDAQRPDSKMTAEQQEAMDCICSYKVKNVYVTGGNRSGKSQMLRRLVAWFLREDDDAQWKRRPEWKGPLTGLLISKSHKQLRGSLLEGIIPFFEGDKDFKIIRNSNYIECLMHKKTGNVIWVLVHENVSQCRERVQSFMSHMCFLDEMPAGAHATKLMEETGARVIDSKGVFASFFTPKSINKAMKLHVESMRPPAGKKFTLSFLNNPGIDEEAKAVRLEEIQAMPEHMQGTLLRGDWMSGEHTVFTVSDEALQAPQNYSIYWRHVVSVDPALNSQQGVIVCAEDPLTSHWYVVKSEKMDKIADVDEGVDRVSRLILQHNWNVTSIVYDPASTYWYKQAKKHEHLRKYKITCPFNKNSTERKDEMISNLQMALGVNLFIGPDNDDLLDEFSCCEWSDHDPSKIKKGQKYHLLDAIRYFVDCMPKKLDVPPPPPKTVQEAWSRQIREGHEQWKQGQQKPNGWRSGGRIVAIHRMTLRR
jgi:hypothetical protein